jgi:4'-phosphopantetheinyl transferase
MKSISRPVNDMKNQTLAVEKQNRQLEAGEIHIWYATLTDPEPSYERLLSTDEKERDSHFIFQRDKNRFIMRHGILRTLLGTYLDITPDRIRLQHGKNGKPSLMDSYGVKQVNFSLSHSEDTAVFAFSNQCELGIDIEKIRNIPEMEKIFEQYFSAKEHETFRLLTKNKRREAFFNCWTRKEAYIKATGNGLYTPLDSFDVSLVPGEPARLLRVEGNPDNVFPWSMYSIEDIPGFKGALAFKGHNQEIYTWQYIQ